MPCSTDRCPSARDCTRHVALLFAGGGLGPTRSGAADAALQALAAELRPCRSGDPAAELRDSARVLASRVRTDLTGDAASYAPDLVLERGAGSPLVIGAIAATAARRAGIALGLLAGPYGTYALAHATLAQPTVLDLADGFAARSVAGRESLHRWLCAHQTAQLVDARRRAHTAGSGSRRTATPGPYAHLGAGTRASGAPSGG